MAVPGSDSFTAPDGDGVNPTNWLDYYGTFLINSNRSHSFQSEAIIGWIRDADIDNNHLARVTIVTCPSDGAGIVIARLNGSAGIYNSQSYYGLQIYKPGGVDQLTLYKFVVGSFTVLQTFTETWTDGNTLEIMINGSTISGFMDSGSGLVELVGSPATDTSTASGVPGLRGYNTSTIFDDFYTDNLVHAATLATMGRTVLDYVD